MPTLDKLLNHRYFGRFEQQGNCASTHIKSKEKQHWKHNSSLLLFDWILSHNYNNNKVVNGNLNFVYSSEIVRERNCIYNNFHCLIWTISLFEWRGYRDSLLRWAHFSTFSATTTTTNLFGKCTSTLWDQIFLYEIRSSASNSYTSNKNARVNRRRQTAPSAS